MTPRGTRRRVQRRRWTRPASCGLLTLAGLGLLTLGLLRATFVRDLDDAWVPPRSTARRQKIEAEAWFGADPFSRPFRVIVAADGVDTDRTGDSFASAAEPAEEDEDGCPPSEATGGVLTSTARLRAAFHVLRLIEAIAVTGDAPVGDDLNGFNETGASSNSSAARYYSLKDVCSRLQRQSPTSPCLSFNPLGYWPAGSEDLVGKMPVDLRRDARSVLYSGGVPVEQRRVFGCITGKDVDTDGNATPSASSPRICDARALIFTFFLDPNVPESVLEAWERKLQDSVEFMRIGGGSSIGGYSSSSQTEGHPEYNAALAEATQAIASAGIVVEAITEISTTIEIEAQSRADESLLVGCYAMMAFTVAMLIRPKSTFSHAPRMCSPACVFSILLRLLPGVVGVVLVVLGAAATLGLCATFVYFTPIAVQVVPYMLVAVGVDNLFIVVRQFNLISRRRNVRAGNGVITGTEAERDNDEDGDVSRWGGKAAVVADVAEDGEKIEPSIYLGRDNHITPMPPESNAVIVENISLSSLKAPGQKPSTVQERYARGSSSSGSTYRDNDDHEDLANSSLMAESLGVSIPSIVITSLTSCIALLIAGTTEVPALRYFCVTAGLGILITLVPVVVVFPGLILLHESLHERIMAGTRRTIPTAQEGNLSFFSVEGYVRILHSKLVQLFVCVAYLALLITSCYGATRVEDGIEAGDVARSGGALNRFLELEERCASHMGPPLFIVIKGVDFLKDSTLSFSHNVGTVSPQPFGADESVFDVAKGMRELVLRVEADPYVDGPVFGWYEEFAHVWLPFNQARVNNSCPRTTPATDADTTMNSFSGTLNRCNAEVKVCAALEMFLNDSVEGRAFQNDVVILRRPHTINASAPCEVAISRLRTLHVPLQGTGDTVAAIKSARVSVRPDALRSMLGENVEIFPISAEYVYYEQFMTARRDHFVRIGSAVLAIGVVVFAFMNATTAAVVVSAMLSISVMTFAALWALGLKLNAVSSVLLVSVIGLADEYICHVVYAMVISEVPGGGVHDKVRDALNQMLYPMTAMAVTSVVGTALLAAAASPVLSHYFFPIFAVAIAVSWFHGCVVLPAVTLLIAARIKS